MPPTGEYSGGLKRLPVMVPTVVRRSRVSGWLAERRSVVGRVSVSAKSASVPVEVAGRVGRWGGDIAGDISLRCVHFRPSLVDSQALIDVPHVNSLREAMDYAIWV